MTPTDELNRLLDVFAIADAHLRLPTVRNLARTIQAERAARSAIVAHFERVTLTPEEAELLTADHEPQCWEMRDQTGTCICGAERINAKLRLISGSGQ